ncbi:MAG: DUF4012 domain-containing protein [Candidatus Moranbacteria bacterium]|nr:DUF4012 domain-containing protein [Candidatus Moranbacteria bacterium]
MNLNSINNNNDRYRNVKFFNSRGFTKPNKPKLTFKSKSEEQYFMELVRKKLARDNQGLAQNQRNIKKSQSYNPASFPKSDFQKTKVNKDFYIEKPKNRTNTEKSYSCGLNLDSKTGFDSRNKKSGRNSHNPKEIIDLRGIERKKRLERYSQKDSVNLRKIKENSVKRGFSKNRQPAYFSKNKPPYTKFSGKSQKLNQDYFNRNFSSNNSAQKKGFSKTDDLNGWSYNFDQNHKRTAQDQKFGKIGQKKFQKTASQQKNQYLVAIAQEAFSPGLKKLFSYSLILAVLIVVIPVLFIAIKGVEEKDNIEQYGNQAYSSLKEAQASIKKADVKTAGKNFDKAYLNFLQAQKKIEEVGGGFSGILKFLPGVSKVESARKISSVGENISLAGKEITAAMEYLMESKEDLKKGINLNVDQKNPIDSQISFTQMFLEVDKRFKKAAGYLDQASVDIEDVDPDDFPKEIQGKIGTLKDVLPKISQSLNKFNQYGELFLDVLGHNGSRKYLLLFQNNHEARATGGFIGSYGIVKVYQGKIENLKIDGIYNPDGQLKEKVIPPRPIQKMTAAWSMRDANWWPDFPTSAQKVSWFWEKTGGPSVDGVITLSPDVILGLLEVTGPIEVEGYGEKGSLVVDKNNFMELIQEEVEVNYDKEENRPKKILSDLTPLIIAEVFKSKPQDWPEVFAVFTDALKKRHIMIYSFDQEIQQLVSDMGWSGEILETQKDYLSVVNTNIGGEKTDGVIDQKIIHKAELQDDGSIVNTLTIQRTHNGGDFDQEWFNKENYNWQRVYVPKGSKLISATGFTRDFFKSPLDYDKLGFKTDYQVKEMEDSYQIDQDSATRIYDEFDKTVFANWVYLEPGQTSTVTYKYLLPFTINIEEFKNPAEAYSLLIQKQAGDKNTQIKTNLYGMEEFDYEYKFPQDMNITKEGWSIEDYLDEDKFYALVVKD